MSYNTIAGRLIAISTVFNSLSQLAFGWISDHVRSVHFLTVGILLPSVCISLLGVAPSISAVVLLLSVSGIGIASFHPQATAQAANFAGRGKSANVSIFITGGNIGQAVGPFLIIIMLKSAAIDDTITENNTPLTYLPVCMIPGMISTLFTNKFLKPKPIEVADTTKSREISGLNNDSHSKISPLIGLYMVAMLRTVTTIGLISYLSLQLDSLGYKNIARSGILASFTFAGSMGILFGGWVSDRISGVIILCVSLVTAAPILYISISLSNNNRLLFIMFLLFGNFILSSSVPANIVMGQQLLPNNQNLATSFMMGAAWGVAGLLNYPIGMLADQFGRLSILKALTLLPVFTAFFPLLIRKK